MPLNKDLLQSQIKQAFKDQQTKTQDPDAALEDLAQKIAAALDAFVKSGTVTVPSGIPVSTAGTAAAQTGATTAPATGTIS